MYDLVEIWSTYISMKHFKLCIAIKLVYDLYNFCINI